MAIDPRHHDLWRRIAAHRLDDPAARLTFTGRLARENGWTVVRAVRVVAEYRRFVFLAMTAGHPVTPSEDVDQAWHLHLAYTRDYWEVFCPDVLGTPLHHGPTRGGADEAARYDGQYRRTLEAYATTFDAPPPEDIWPAAERRFGPDLAWRRVNVARHWVVPKPAWLVGRRGLVVALAAVPFVTTAPLISAGIPNPLDLKASPFLGLFAALAAGSLVAGALLRQRLRPAGDPGVTLDSVEPVELALLADDGRVRAAAAGIAALDPEHAPAATGPMLADLRQRLDALGDCPPADRLTAAIDVAREEFEPRLVARGLLVGSWWDTPTPWIILAPAAATLALGCAKIVVGISRGKPVGFLLMGCFALAVASVLALGRRPRRTRQGDALVHEAWRRFRESGQQDAWRQAGDTAALVPLAVALFGVAALRGESLAPLVDAVRRRLEGSSGGSGCSGSTGGDSGDGGGGGCGGCGGCGGGGD